MECPDISRVGEADKADSVQSQKVIILCGQKATMGTRLQNNRATKILDNAVAGHYAVPAMCCYNAEGIIGCVRAAEAKKAPLMLLLFPWAVQYAGGLLVHLAAEAARNASVPIAVHMDHAQTPEIVKRAADLGGFDSIMCDMSHYEKEENLRLTSELTRYCHERGIATEAEPGRIEGGEDGVAATADLEGLLTTPEVSLQYLLGCFHRPLLIFDLRRLSIMNNILWPVQGSL